MSAPQTFYELYGAQEIGIQPGISACHREAEMKLAQIHENTATKQTMPLLDPKFIKRKLLSVSSPLLSGVVHTGTDAGLMVCLSGRTST